jgi:acetyl esterase/lipase
MIKTWLWFAGDAGSSNQFYRLRTSSGSGAPFLWRSSSFSRLAEWREHRHESITEEPDEDQADDTTSSEGDAASPAPEASSVPVEFSGNTTPRDLEPPPTLPTSSSTASAQSMNSSSDDGVIEDDAHSITSETKVLLYIHGGGFVASLFPNDALLLARWAKQEDIVIVFVHYSLAPEARYPVALNECLRVYKWLRTHTSKVRACLPGAYRHRLA